MPGDAALELRVHVAGAEATRPRLDVDLRLERGVTVLMGHSGAGKSTLLMAVAGLLRPQAGRVVLGDTVVFDAAARVFVPPHQRRIALVFQSLALFPHLSAVGNVAYGLRDVLRADRRARALEWLGRTRAEHLADRYPATYSGGEAQRVALARALASEPRALLMDEPFAAMDAALRDELGRELRALVERLAIPTLLATHDREDALKLGGRILHLDAGRLARDERLVG